jgi:Flp pilus assembly protein TadG
MLVVTALCMTALLGFVALAVDVGVLFRAKRNIQIAADAAAVAGALDYHYNGIVSLAQTAAANAATANGYTNGSGASVTVNCAPAVGPHASASCNGYFEVVITAPNTTAFMGTFGYRNMNVTARAVAGNGGPSGACVIVTDPAAFAAMNLQGPMTAVNCGVIVDSSSGNALSITGGGSLSAGSIAVVGGGGGGSNPAPVTGAAPMSDPLQLTGPTPLNGGCASAGYTDSRTHLTTSGTIDTTTTTLTGTVSGPGTGRAICYANPVILNNAQLGPGIYVFENGVTTNGTVTTNGATIDLYGGSLTATTGTVLALNAPASGETNGIALMEPRNNINQIAIPNGNVTGSINGIIYAPNAQLLVQGSGGGLSFTSDLIVHQLSDQNATLTINNYGTANPGTTPITKVTLVE